MPARRVNEPNDEAPKSRRRPATTPEAREKQLVSLAVDIAEEQMHNRTVSSQVLSHYLKLGTRQHELELEKLRYDTQYMQAKIENLESAKRMEEMYDKVLAAIQSYSPDSEEVYDPEVFEDEFE